MKKNILKIFKISIVVFLVIACTTISNRINQQNLLTHLKNQNYKTAQSIVENKNFFTDKKSILLKKLETATTYYLSGNYYQALMNFDEAKKISDSLFTVSISRKIMGAVDLNADNYYGNKYEISMIRFYQSLLHYLLYINGKYENYALKKDNNKVSIVEKILNEDEKYNHLVAAKNIAIEWNSLLNKYKKEKINKNVYKDSIVAQLWGAFIHEHFDNYIDRQISLQLSKDALSVLFKNYNSYSIFNNKYEKFNDNYNKFSSFSEQYIKNNFVEPTKYAINFTNYVNKQINDIEQSKKHNVLILLKDGFINQKKVKNIKFPLTLAYFTTIGGDDMYYFTHYILFRLEDGLIPFIDIEIPYIEEETVNSDFYINIYGANDNFIQESKITLVEPLSNIAYKTINDEINTFILKLSANLISKHLTAISVAYDIYKQSNNSFMAWISYSASVKLINETSRADLRQWFTLPANIRMNYISLKEGNYKIQLIKEKNNQKYLILEKNVFINEKNNLIDLNV